MKVSVSKSDRKDKKLKVQLQYEDGKQKTIYIGQKGEDDFTRGATDQQKSNYISRHTARENWNKSGIETAGFWARHLLWNKRTLTASKSDIEKKYDVQIN